MNDIENVIEKLMELRRIGLNPFVNECTDEAIQTIREIDLKLQENLELPENYQIGFQDGWVRALESSKESEEVCEWRRMGDDWYSFEPTCDSDVGYRYTENMICEWKYCPYCKRKLKVVD